MLPILEVEAFLEKLPAEQHSIALELRSLVARAAPQACEIFQWRGLSYYDARRGGTVGAAICQIGFERDHVRLGFIHGAFLPDPHKLLEGDRKYKRFVRIYSYDAAPWDDLEQLNSGIGAS